MTDVLFGAIVAPVPDVKPCQETIAMPLNFEPSALLTVSRIVLSDCACAGKAPTNRIPIKKK
jgi:hypothetical protein